MNLDKFLNMKPKTQQEQKMDVQNPQTNRNIPWVQKYRPNRLDQLAFQEQVTSSLRNVLKTGSLPHLLFYGPAGTGKTSAILAFSKQLFGPRFYKERILELNASDQRGIGVIRDKVKTFAQKVIVKNPDKNYPCPSIKVIVLDQADLLTSQAQSALRRVIEDNSSTTRFCIICNYITKIIEPVASRCVKFRFKPIPENQQLNKIRFICEKQGVKLNEYQMKNLLERGDLRQSINSLQSLHSLNNIPSNILPLPQALGVNILDRIFQCRNVNQVYGMAQQMSYQGYAYDQLLNVLAKAIDKKVDDERKKAIMLERISKAEEALMVGAVELPIMEVMTSIYYVSNLRF